VNSVKAVFEVSWVLHVQVALVVVKPSDLEGLSLRKSLVWMTKVEYEVEMVVDGEEVVVEVVFC